MVFLNILIFHPISASEVYSMLPLFLEIYFQLFSILNSFVMNNKDGSFLHDFLYLGISLKHNLSETISENISFVTAQKFKMPSVWSGPLSLSSRASRKTNLQLGTHLQNQDTKKTWTIYLKSWLTTKLASVNCWLACFSSSLQAGCSCSQAV